MKNCSSLSPIRRPIRRPKAKLLFSASPPREQRRNRDDRRVSRSCDGLQSDGLYESASVKRHAYFIGSSIRCRKNANGFKTK